MDRIVIEGGAQLNGEIGISGAKNSALKLMAAALLTDEPLTLTSMPRLADSRFMGHLLARLGVSVEEGPGSQMRLHAAQISDTCAPYDLVRKMRATFNHLHCSTKFLLPLVAIVLIVWGISIVIRQK